MAEALICTEAIRANAAILSARAGSGGFTADVAYDAYGHGAIAAAHAAIAGGAAAIAVHTKTAADQLRAEGILLPVVLGRPLGALELYGLTDNIEFAPAMQIRTIVIGTKTVEAGEGVSYGYTWRATKRTNLAMVELGYADGVDRAASNIGAMELGGKQRKIAGRVAMNVTMLDLGSDRVNLGDEAMVIGGERRASDWAISIGRRPDEVVMVFGQKLQRSWA